MKTNKKCMNHFDFLYGKENAWKNKMCTKKKQKYVVENGGKITLLVFLVFLFL